jgi:hypothetical protein
MAAIQRALLIEQGATFTLGFTWHQEGDVVNGVVTAGDPYDLTGWTARMQLRQKQGSPVLLEATTENGKITLGGTTGRVDVKFTDADTGSLTVASGRYDLELVDPAGDVLRLLQGSVTVDANITQDPDEPVLT